jgi:hypothetical protein
MLKILLPVSFFTALLEYVGFFGKIDFILGPVMRLIDLPAAAAFPLAAGMLGGIYSGIAAMVALPFTPAEMTLISVFLLIAHNLIQEGIIQGKSGMQPLAATASRLIAAVFTVWVISWVLGPLSSVAGSAGASAALLPFGEFMTRWAFDSAGFLLQIFLIVMFVMIILEALKAFKVIPLLVDLLAPALRMLGLSREVGIAWLAASVFGIVYGAAVIVEEAKEGKLSREDLTRLHISIGINHSMIDDPVFFMAAGVGAFWLWVPRLISAILAVQMYNLWRIFRG